MPLCKQTAANWTAGSQSAFPGQIAECAWTPGPSLVETLSGPDATPAGATDIASCQLLCVEAALAWDKGELMRATYDSHNSECDCYGATMKNACVGPDEATITNTYTAAGAPGIPTKKCDPPPAPPPTAPMPYRVQGAIVLAPAAASAGAQAGVQTADACGTYCSSVAPDGSFQFDSRALKCYCFHGAQGAKQGVKQGVKPPKS